MTKKFTQGFTLIELLVVIAIIGVLSTVVLASLNSARGKGIDASRKAAFKNLVNPGVLYYESNNESYSGICTTNTNAIRFQSIYQAAGATASNCTNWAAGYKIRVQLQVEDNLAPANTPDWICTDNRGNIYTYGADPGGGNTVCP